MEGVPEGTERAHRGLPKMRVILPAVVVAAYLIFRLVQGMLWLAGHL